MPPFSLTLFFVLILAKGGTLKSSFLFYDLEMPEISSELVFLVPLFSYKISYTFLEISFPFSTGIYWVKVLLSESFLMAWYADDKKK